MRYFRPLSQFSTASPVSNPQVRPWELPTHLQKMMSHSLFVFCFFAFYLCFFVVVVLCCCGVRVTHVLLFCAVNSISYCKISYSSWLIHSAIKSAAFPDPCRINTGIHFSNTSTTTSNVDKSPSMTITNTGTLISKSK